MRTHRAITSLTAPHTDQLLTSGASVSLSGDSAHHLLRVLRVRTGEAVELVDPVRRALAPATVSSCGDQQVALTLTGPALTQPAAPALTLLVALCRWPVIENIVGAALEVGITRIVFFAAERTNTAPDAAAFENKLPRLQRMLETSLLQCGACYLPEISRIDDLGAELDELHSSANSPENQRRFVCVAPSDDSAPDEQPIKITTILSRNTPVHTNSTSQLEGFPNSADSYLVVGPEGGFTADELAHLSAHAYERVSLGDCTMRVETAAMVASAMVTLLNN